MNATRAAAAVGLSLALTVGVTAPAEAATTVRRKSNITLSHWYSTKYTKWTVTTQSHGRGHNGGNYDRAKLCLSKSGARWQGSLVPRRANFRIYAYDSHGRLVASRSGNNTKFGHWNKGGDRCRGLSVRKSRHAVRFLFRVNVRKDARGEGARNLSVRAR